MIPDDSIELICCINGDRKIFCFRQLGLMGCNIFIMKRFQPFLMFTGFAFSESLIKIVYITIVYDYSHPFNGID